MWVYSAWGAGVRGAQLSTRPCPRAGGGLWPDRQAREGAPGRRSGRSAAYLWRRRRNLITCTAVHLLAAVVIPRLLRAAAAWLAENASISARIGLIRSANASASAEALYKIAPEQLSCTPLWQQIPNVWPEVANPARRSLLPTGGDSAAPFLPGAKAR
jgi:hypothetical protein